MAKFFMMRIYAVVALLFCFGCASHSQEERIEVLESHVAGQQVMDIRLGQVEDRLTQVERKLEARAEEGTSKNKSGKKNQPAPVTPRQVDPIPTATSSSPASAALVTSLPVSSTNSSVNTSAASGSAPASPADSSVNSALTQLAQDISPSSFSTTTPKSGAMSVAPTTSAKSSQEVAAVPVSSSVSGSGVSGAGVAMSGGAMDGGATNSGTSVHFGGATPGEGARAAMSQGARYVDPAGAAIVPPAPTASDNSAMSAAGEPAGSSASAAPVAKASTSVQGEYAHALAVYEKHQFSSAQKLFEAFLQKNGTHSLAPNARYWLGECLYSRGDYSAAIMQFKEVVEKHPKHAKSAAALLKIGYSYAQLKDTENARFYLEILLEDFPSSPPAALAKKKLAALTS